MARPIRSIDLHLPLESNDGRPIPDSKFMSVLDELVDRFGGVTSVQRQFPLQGVWKSGQTIYHDPVVVFTAMDFSDWTQLQCLRYLARLKTQLMRRFDQLEILITVTELLAI
jgi:hypothetical protein